MSAAPQRQPAPPAGEDPLGRMAALDGALAAGMANDARLHHGVPAEARGAGLDFIQMTGLTRGGARVRPRPVSAAVQAAPAGEAHAAQEALAARVAHGAAPAAAPPSAVEALMAIVEDLRQEQGYGVPMAEELGALDPMTPPVQAVPPAPADLAGWERMVADAGALAEGPGPAEAAPESEAPVALGAEPESEARRMPPTLALWDWEPGEAAAPAPPAEPPAGPAPGATDDLDALLDALAAPPAPDGGLAARMESAEALLDALARQPREPAPEDVPPPAAPVESGALDALLSALAPQTPAPAPAKAAMPPAPAAPPPSAAAPRSEPVAAQASAPPAAPEPAAAPLHARAAAPDLAAAGAVRAIAPAVRPLAGPPEIVVPDPVLYARGEQGGADGEEPDYGEPRRRRRHRPFARPSQVLRRMLFAGAMIAALCGAAFAIYHALSHPAVQSADALLSRARAAAEAGRHAEASALFAEFADRFPERSEKPEAAFRAGFELQLNDAGPPGEARARRERALGLLEGFVRDHPANAHAPRAVALMGVLAYALGRDEEAVRLLNDPGRQAADPEAELTVLRTLAAAHRRLGQYREAESRYRQAAAAEKNLWRDVDFADLGDMLRQEAEGLTDAVQRRATLERAAEALEQAANAAGIAPARRDTIAAASNWIDAELARTPEAPAADAAESGAAAGAE